ncbi:MAG TPA: GNAT family N-acetyltransferase [Terriglobia bacterium]|nr:GNAT family N-acetyltransferase [Terriglobia bacterium]
MTQSFGQELKVRLLRAAEKAAVDQYLRLYSRCFNPDERVSSSIIRRVLKSSARAVNPVHLFAVYRRREIIGGSLTVALPAFQVVFGSYIFVRPSMRGQGFGATILRETLRQEQRGAGSSFRPWRLYGEVTPASGSAWRRTLARAGFRFFPTPWPIPSYHEPRKILSARLCYYPLQPHAPERLSQPAMLAYIYSLFYGPENMHRHLLPRLKRFVALDAPGIHHKDTKAQREKDGQDRQK